MNIALYMDTFWLLTGLAFSALTSATLLPGTSEAALLAVVHGRADLVLAAWGVATAANTAGSLVSYALGRLLPPKQHPSRAAGYLKRYGSVCLLLAWVPFIGDALPVAAGRLRMNAWLCVLMLLVGKGLRYAFLIGGWQLFS